ncbi:MAG: cobalt-precorrin 5A hydrolase [Eubacteriales bacterium]|nr:cobalt-precorrin 5A hydrolase [Eubacteriales bacterium]
MSTAYYYLTPEGKSLAEKLAAGHPGDLYGKENFKENLQKGFQSYDYLVCIMATGIVVRILAPLIVHKTSDPGVVVLDQKGQHAISLLSGHLGGANDLAREMAFLSGGEAVITTATDVAGELSFDTFAKKRNMAIENIGKLKHISGALLEGKAVRVVTDLQDDELENGKKDGKFILKTVEGFSEEFNHSDPLEFLSKDALSMAGATSVVDGMPTAEATSVVDGMPTVIIDEGYTLSEEDESRLGAPVLYLRPRTIFAGIGCKRNMEAAPIEEALLETLKKEGLSPLSLNAISTIPLKADEPGILTTADHLHVPLKVIPTEEIEALDINELGIKQSDFVAKQTGVLSVSTASSYLASGKGKILVDKAKFKGITIALSKMS